MQTYDCTPLSIQNKGQSTSTTTKITLFRLKTMTFSMNTPTESLSTFRRNLRNSTSSKSSLAISRQSWPQFRSQLSPTEAMTSMICKRSSFQTTSLSTVPMENLWTTTPTSCQKRKLCKLRSQSRKKINRLWILLRRTKRERRNLWSLKTVMMKPKTFQRTT